MILVIDNYDSFVFNVARYLDRLTAETRVLRNDAVTVESIATLAPRAIIVSPGPCAPRDAGISLELVRKLSGTVPILGVCLGHQVIGEAFGGTVTRALHPMHGRASMISHNERGLFRGLEQPARIGRYHSLIVEETAEMLVSLNVDARSTEGEIMAVSHRTHPTFGVQFHPESVLTDDGDVIFSNFLDLADSWHGR